MRILPASIQATLKTSALTSLAIGAALLGSVSAQEPSRPDQVFVLDRTGEYRTVACEVQTDGLDEVIVTLRGKDKKYTSSKVSQVLFGTVPASYSDAQSYAARGDLDNALRQFRLAADDAEAREAVRAKARFEAGKVLMKAAAVAGASVSFDDAAAEFDRFLADFATSRLVPQARRLDARAKLLAGKAQAAGELGAAVLDQLDPSRKNAYTLPLCMSAGLEGARAFLYAGDLDAADALYKKIQAQLTTLMAEAEGDERAKLDGYSQAAQLGEGWRLLADGKAGQAAGFFQNKLRGSLPGSLRYNARLGYAEGLLGQRKYREAQLEFAAVSGLDPTSRDDVAQALVGLARTAQDLLDSDSKDLAKVWLQSCIDQYGDTPAAQKARELAASL
jgi:TolA-binding protein